jgi:hypothetical protein
MLTIPSPNTDRLLLTDAEIAAAIPNVAGPVLAKLNARVSAAIVRACHVAAAGAIPPTLRLEEVVDTYRLKSHQKALILSRRPVVSVTSLVEGSTTLAEDVDFEVEADAGLLYRLSGDERVCWSSGKVVMTYSAGWATVPDDLRLAAEKLAQVFHSEGGSGGSGLKRESIPGVIEREWWVGPSDDPAIPQEILDLLGPYTNHWVG